MSGSGDVLLEHDGLKFDPKFFGDKLKVINPYGSVGVVTLWSPVKNVFKRLLKVGVDLEKDSSRIAVMGNLYGEGFRQLLRNLLYNPQITGLAIFGNALNNSGDYLPAFFNKGVEPFEGDMEYTVSDSRLDPKPVRVVDTDYVMDDLVAPESFETPPALFSAGSYDDVGAREVGDFLKTHPRGNGKGKRIYVEAPEVKVTAYPGNVRAHMIVESAPSEAWVMVVQRILRFGRRVALRKGERIELQNLKVVIEKPVFEDDETIEKSGFDSKEFSDYQEKILSPAPPRTHYTYGHRIRAYFGIDGLDEAAAQLKEDLDDRKAYISLWDNKTDITGAHSPCLVSLFFRKQSKSLHLTATYRSHNAAKAWLENVYGLMALREYVAERIGSSKGSITVVSHSISLDPTYLEKMIPIQERAAKAPGFRYDPQGYFRITLDEDKIVVHHYSPDGFLLGAYQGKKPLTIQQKIYRDNVISDIGHAMYVGRQLQKAWQRLQDGTPYVQE